MALTSHWSDRSLVGHAVTEYTWGSRNTRTDHRGGSRSINADVEYASRHGIAPVAGQVTIQGGRIDHVGLHGVNFEPSIAVEARSIRGVVDGIDIRHHGELPTGRTDFAVAAAGHPIGTGSIVKPFVHIVRVTGDSVRITVRDTSRVVICQNVSDMWTTADFAGSDMITYGDNRRILGSREPGAFDHLLGSPKESARCRGTDYVADPTFTWRDDLCRIALLLTTSWPCEWPRPPWGAMGESLGV